MKFGPYPPAPKTARFQLHTQISGGPVTLTRFFMSYTNALSATDATTLLTTLATSWNTRMAPFTSSLYTLTACSVNDLGSRTGVESTLVVSHVGQGGGGGGAATSFVMSAHVALKYRGGHSRVYIPGVESTFLADQNTWSAASQGTVFSAWTGMLGDLATSPPVGVGAMSQVTVRYISSDKADFPTPPDPFVPPYLLATPMVLPVTSWSSNPQVGSQRRRNQQGG